MAQKLEIYILKTLILQQGMLDLNQCGTKDTIELKLKKKKKPLEANKTSG